MSIPENILNSSKSSYQNVKLDESSNSSNNEIEDSEGENVGFSSNAREKITKSGKISRAPTKFEEEFWRFTENLYENFKH